MTQEEINDYNRRCAEFLGKDKSGSDVTWTFPSYLNGSLWVDEHFFSNTDEYCGRRQTKVSELKFHSDWNWIMEVVKAIEKLRYLVVIQSNFCQIQEVGTKENSFNPLIIASLYSNTKKEAVVLAINQFLIWYNENK